MTIRTKILLISLLPFIILLAGVVGAIYYWWVSPQIYLALGLICIGVVAFNRATSSFAELISSECKDVTSAIPACDFVPVEYEVFGTEDKFHFVADAFGVIAKNNNQIVIAIGPNRRITTDANRMYAVCKTTSVSSSIKLYFKDTNLPIIEYSIAPVYTGNDPEIGSSTNKKVTWFCNKMGIQKQDAPN